MLRILGFVALLAVAAVAAPAAAKLQIAAPGDKAFEQAKISAAAHLVCSGIGAEDTYAALSHYGCVNELIASAQAPVAIASTAP